MSVERMRCCPLMCIMVKNNKGQSVWKETKKSSGPPSFPEALNDLSCQSVSSNKTGQSAVVLKEILS